MNSKTEDRIITTFFMLAFVGVIVLAVYSQLRWNECNSRGGVVVETKGNWICTKLEKI